MPNKYLLFSVSYMQKGDVMKSTCAFLSIFISNAHKIAYYKKDYSQHKNFSH
jgi:hypothetical protein